MIQIALLTEFVRKNPTTHSIYLFHSGKEGVKRCWRNGVSPLLTLPIPPYDPTFSQSSSSIRLDAE